MSADHPADDDRTPGHWRFPDEQRVTWSEEEGDNPQTAFSVSADDDRTPSDIRCPHCGANLAGAVATMIVGIALDLARAFTKGKLP